MNGVLATGAVLQAIDTQTNAFTGDGALHPSAHKSALCTAAVTNRSDPLMLLALLLAVVDPRDLTVHLREVLTAIVNSG